MGAESGLCWQAPGQGLTEDRDYGREVPAAALVCCHLLQSPERLVSTGLWTPWGARDILGPLRGASGVTTGPLQILSIMGCRVLHFLGLPQPGAGKGRKANTVNFPMETRFKELKTRVYPGSGMWGAVLNFQLPDVPVTTSAHLDGQQSSGNSALWLHTAELWRRWLLGIH